jgi:hypothetical protein
MAIESIRCPVLGRTITRVTDLEDTVTRVICPELEASTGVCRLKRQAHDGGRLAELLERVREHTLDTKGTTCHLTA